MKLEPLKLQCWKCCSWQFFQKVEPLGFSEGKFRHSCLAEVKVEGKSNCPQEKEVCLIPPQTKNGGKNPQPFSPFRNSPTRFLMCPPTRLQLANRLETAETFSSGKDIFQRVEGEYVAPALVVFGVVWLGGYEASILGYPSRSRYKFGAT